MFETSMGLRENPFLAGHLPKYVFPSREHQEALAHLRYGIQNREPFVLITGEVGTGKTTAVYDALAEWGSRAVVALITNSALTRSELLEEICLRFGVTLQAPISKPHALVELQRQLSASRARGELAILLVDEAQNLDRELLEEIRLLSNLEEYGEYLLQIFLVGQPELETKLSQRELRQLRQRIGIHYRILPLSATETARYIHHRVSVAGGNAEDLFPSEACVEIYRVTNGIPREINVVAGQALLNAFVEDAASVSPEHVRAVEREIEFQSVLRDRPPSAADKPEPEAPRARPTRGRSTASGGTRTTRGRKSKAAAPAQPEPPAETPEPPARRSISRSASLRSAPPEGETGRVAPVPFPGLPTARPGPGREPAAPASPMARRGEPTASERVSPVLPAWIDRAVERQREAAERAPAGPGAQITRFPSPATPYVGPVQPPYGTPPPAPPWPDQAHGGNDAEREGQPPDSHSLPLRPIDAETDDVEPTSRTPIAWPVASIMIVALAIGVLLLARFGPWTIQSKNPPAANRPVPAAPPAVVPPEDAAVSPAAETSAPPVRTARPATGTQARPATGTQAQPATGTQAQPARSSAATGETPGTAAPAPGPAPAQGPAPATEAPATPPEAGSAGPPVGTAPAEVAEPQFAAPVRTFSIEVGTYLNEARAQSERTRLREGTAFPTRVVTVDEQGVAMHRVVVGAFDDRETAERAASDLVQRGLVNEARVVAVLQPAAGPR